MKFIVSRSTWLRGEGTCDSFLLRKSDGKKCCLGFATEQCGVDLSAIGRYYKEPGDIPIQSRTSDFEAMLTIDNDLEFSWMEEAMFVNDDTTLTDAEREAKLIDIFKTGGHDLEFID